MRVGRALAAAAAVAVLAGCGDSGREEIPRGDAVPVTTTQAATTTASPGVLAPTDTGRSATYQMDTMITSVEEVTSRYGVVTVFTFQLVNAGDKIFDGYNVPTPTVVYGPAGTPAEHTVSLSEGYGEGVVGSIPPGSRQTVKWAYAVPKAELNPAVVSMGSLVWQGDFSTFARQ